MQVSEKHWPGPGALQPHILHEMSQHPSSVQYNRVHQLGCHVAVFSYLAEQHLKRRNNPSTIPVATATARLEKAASLSKTAQSQKASPVPAVGNGPTPEPVVVNLKKGKKGSQRFSKCSS